MGVGHFDHTNCFFANSEKTAARSAAVVLHTFLYINFAPFQKISAQGHLRSGHQVRSSAPTSKKYLWFRRDYSFWCINMKLSGVDKGISTYKTYISELWFRWPDVRSILRPHHYKTMGKCSYAAFPKVRVATCYLCQDIPTLGHSRWPVCSFDPMTPPSGHSRSYEVTFVFCP